MHELIISLLIGYLVGSISFSRLILRVKAGERKISDLRIQFPESGDTATVDVFGANAASMILGARYGIGIGILDMLKVIIPMLLVRFLIYPNEYYYLVVSIGALLGHNWPLYHRFRGGRGFSVIFGSFIVVDWLGAIVEPIIGILFGMLVVGNIMFAYSSWLWLLPLWFWFRIPVPNNLILVSYAIVITVIFTIATIPEIRTVAKFRRSGKLEEYQRALFDSSPRWRGMKRMQDRVSALGIKRYIIGVFVIIILVLLLLYLPSLPTWMQITSP